MKKVSFVSYALIFFWPFWLFLVAQGIFWARGANALPDLFFVYPPILAIVILAFYGSYVVWRSRVSALGSWLTVYATWLVMVGLPSAFFIWQIERALCYRLAMGEHGAGPEPLPGSCVSQCWHVVLKFEIPFHLFLIVALGISGLFYRWVTRRADQGAS